MNTTIIQRHSHKTNPKKNPLARRTRHKTKVPRIPGKKRHFAEAGKHSEGPVEVVRPRINLTSLQDQMHRANQVASRNDKASKQVGFGGRLAALRPKISR